MNVSRLDPLLLKFDDGGAALKLKYRGELFPVNPSGRAAARNVLDDFQEDPMTGDPKGIIMVALGDQS